MYIASVPNRASPPAILLRESYREDGKVKTRTLANLSKLPKGAIAFLRRYLGGERFVSASEAFESVQSWHHGHVQAVREAMMRIGFDKLIRTRSCRERDLVMGMVAARILAPHSKLATTRWWHITSLPRTLGIEDADEDELYAAMDWLLERQERIEQKLASRHLREGGMVLYDLSSSYFEGSSCPLAALGYNRDGKKGKLQVNYGLLTDGRGCPVAVSVFKGNTSDTKTLLPQLERVQHQFGIQTVVIVGDRGMISQAQIDRLRAEEGIDWITALKSSAIKKLVEEQRVQLDLFDECNLFELTHPQYPGERLVACRNPALAERRAKVRESLLEATAKELEKIQARLERGKLRGRDKIAKRVRRVFGPNRLADCFSLDISDDALTFQLTDERSAAAVLFDAFADQLSRLRSKVASGAVQGKERISAQLQKIAEQHKLAPHVVFTIAEDDFDCHLADKEGALKAALGQFCEAVEQIRDLVMHGKFGGKDKIGIRIGRVVDKYKVAKHFVIDIRDDGFEFSVNQPTVASEAALDGIYVIRTSVDKAQLSPANAVRHYKSLSQVERAFRSIKTVDLKVRPIYHYMAQRVRAHIFLCMLAYYVEWHLREAWRPLLFCDEELEAKSLRDPVAPAQRSKSALRKVHTKTLDEGAQVQSFQTLIQSLSGIVLNLVQAPGLDDDASAFEIVTTPNPTQQRAFDLLKTIRS
jgi:transposase